MYSLASIYNLIVFYFAFKEKPGWAHINGMILIFAAIVCLLFASANKDEISSSTQISSSFYAFMAILYGALTAVNFSIKHFLIRKFKQKYKTLELLTDSLILEYFIHTCIVVSVAFTQGISLKHFLLAQGASIMYMAGFTTLGLAVSIGYAGPANALGSL